MAKVVSGGLFLVAAFFGLCAFFIGQPAHVSEAPAPEVVVRESAGTPVPADLQPNSPTPPVDDFELPQEKQEQIWDAEHVTFEIETRLGGRIKSAIRSHDLEAIAATLRDNFQGSLLPRNPHQTRSHGGIDEMLLDGHGSTPELVGKASFVAAFGEMLSDFDAPQSLTLRVLKLFPGDEDGEWDAEILLSVFGTSKTGGLLELDSHAQALIVFTADEELDSQGVIAAWDEETRAVRSRQETFFEEVTQEWGLDQAPLEDNWELPTDQVQQYRFQMAVADYDLDGYLDIAVATKHTSALLRWDPELTKFTDVTEQTDIRKRHTPTRRPRGPIFSNQKPVDLAGWIDYDNDGFPDLVLGNRLYHNRQGTRFEDVTSTSGLKWGLQSMGVHIADYDADGLLDLYILEQASSETSRRNTPLRWVNDDDFGEPNRLWRNEGNGRFRDVTTESGAGGGKRHSLAAAWFFYDDDRFPDLYIANDFNENVLLRNRGDGTFEDVSHASHTSDFATSMGVTAGDINNDGMSDLYVANMFSKMGRRIIAYVGEDDYPPGIYEQIQGSCAGNRLYLRDPTSLTFTAPGENLGIHGVGWAYAPAMADFDNDGWLDLYATTGFLSFTRHKPDG